MITEELIRQDLLNKLKGVEFNNYSCPENTIIRQTLENNGIKNADIFLSFRRDRFTVTISVDNTHGHNGLNTRDLILMTVTIKRAHIDGKFVYSDFIVEFGDRYGYDYKKGSSLEEVIEALNMKAAEIANQADEDTIRTAEILKMVEDRYDVDFWKAYHILTMAGKLYYKEEVKQVLNKLIDDEVNVLEKKNK